MNILETDTKPLIKTFDAPWLNGVTVVSLNDAAKFLGVGPWVLAINKAEEIDLLVGCPVKMASWHCVENFGRYGDAQQEVEDHFGSPQLFLYPYGVFLKILDNPSVLLSPASTQGE